MNIDPRNRLVADQLEADWNDKLHVLTDAREEYEQKDSNLQPWTADTRIFSSRLYIRPLASHLISTTYNQKFDRNVSIDKISNSYGSEDRLSSKWLGRKGEHILYARTALE